MKTIFFSIPILINTFNRIRPVKELLSVLSIIKPKRLYIASDGHRKHVKNEIYKVDEIRKYILDNIDWECEVKTLFRDENLGCKYALHGAVQWFFNQEKKGIVLEDDILPSLHFFTFTSNVRVWT